eukprot:INCI9200.3.p1 GENE.INCI9200.3~~INCI9200.3.p1  ORF type:complete len:542 (+),score=113.47 INCI9200.3:161-1786(+)
MPFPMSLANVRRLTMLSVLTTEEIIQALSHLAGDCNEVDSDFVASFFAELDGGLDLEPAVSAAKAAFVRNLCRLLKSDDGGKAVIPLADLSVALSMLSKDNPVERVFMVIGLYQLHPEPDSSSSDLVMKKAHVFHFLQQVARFLMALQSQLEDGCREETDTQAIVLTEDVFASAVTGNDSSNKKEQSKEVHQEPSAVQAAIPNISFEDFAEWWVRSELDVDSSVDAQSSEALATEERAHRRDEADCETNFVVHLFHQLLEKARRNAASKAGTNSKLRPDDFVLTYEDLEQSVHDTQHDDPLHKQTVALFLDVHSHLRAAAGAAGSTAGRTAVPDTGIVLFEAFFVAVQFVIGIGYQQDLVGDRPGKAQTQMDDQAKLAELAFRLFAQPRAGNRSRATHSFAHRLRSQYLHGPRRRLNANEGTDGQSVVEASDRFVEECEMGLPEMTRFLTSAYKCVFAFGSAQSATVPKAAADAQATGESALRTESPQRSAFLRSVEALESYRVTRLGLGLEEFTKFYKECGLFRNTNIVNSADPATQAEE